MIHKRPTTRKLRQNPIPRTDVVPKTTGDSNQGVVSKYLQVPRFPEPDTKDIVAKALSGHHDDPTNRSALMSTKEGVLSEALKVFASRADVGELDGDATKTPLEAADDEELDLDLSALED